MSTFLTLSAHEASLRLTRLDGRPIPDLATITRRRLALYTPFGGKTETVCIRGTGDAIRHATTGAVVNKVEVSSTLGNYYLAGPMRGYPLFNFPAFLMAARILTARGFTIKSPAEKDIEAGFDPSRGLEEQKFDMGAAFRWDMNAVVETDGTILMTGWEKSSGAKIERLVAQMCNRDVYLLTADYQLIEAPALPYTLEWGTGEAPAWKDAASVDAETNRVAGAN